MERLFVVTLEGNIYSCKQCKTHLALSEDIIFESTLGWHSLFHKVVNVTVGEGEERMMITGLHTIADIFCVGCGSIVGWKYECVHENSQKHKEGKTVLRRFKILGPDENYGANHDEAHAGGSGAHDEGGSGAHDEAHAGGSGADDV